jgi:hypothetical protein
MADETSPPATMTWAADLPAFDEVAAAAARTRGAAHEASRQPE